MIHLILVLSSSSYIDQILILVFTCHAEVPCIEGDMHLNTHSTHSEIHTSAFALSGFSLRTQFSDPVTTYTACVLSLGSAGITVMNGPNAPRQGQTLYLLKQYMPQPTLYYHLFTDEVWEKQSKPKPKNSVLSAVTVY